MKCGTVCRIVAFLGSAVLVGCANFNTIERTTSFPAGDAKAVHLDVQQRLFIMNKLNRYCAEPSPDAMAAYAASLGLGAAAPAKGSLSLSGVGESTAASIGLRTQSITLMRDALYRMCEAYANGAVGDAQVVTLLNRSQDLTAVILAVEQLTGAVAANQAALTGSAGANASATALNNSKLFAEATANEARTLKRLEESKTEQVAASEKLAVAEEALTRAESAQEGLEKADPPDDDKILAAKREVAFRRGMRDAAATTVKSADARAELNQRVYDNAATVAAEVAKSPDSSLTSSTAITSGSSQFGTVESRLALSKEATIALAGAVKDIVVAALGKDYVVDSCMSVLTSNRIAVEPDARQREVETREFCRLLVNAMVLEKVVQAEARVELAKANRIALIVDEAAKIIMCISREGVLDPQKRNQLFADANATGKLTAYQGIVLEHSDLVRFKTMLAQNPDVRSALAAAVGSSKACK